MPDITDSTTIWPHQDVFRGAVESTAESSLGEIGAGVDPECLLVGFRTEPAKLGWRVVPSRHVIANADYSGIEGRAAELYTAEHPSDEYYGSTLPPSATTARLNAARASAIVEVL